MAVSYDWRGAFSNAEVEALHSEGFDHRPVPAFDWQAQLDRYSLGWVCGRTDHELVGFVNVAWDGSRHAFVLDTVVADAYQRHGIGSALISIAVRESKAAGCEWLHVDFEDHLAPFYFGACGFKFTKAGLLRLRDD